MSEKKIHPRQPSKNEATQCGPWSIDVELGILRDGRGAEIRLEPRLSKLISVLMNYSGTFVARRDLIDNVWPDAVVTEQSLTRAISDLRKFLRANLAAPPIIETASKQGYRLSYPPLYEVTRRSVFAKVVKRIVYGLGVIVLLVLVLRGLNY